MWMGSTALAGTGPFMRGCCGWLHAWVKGLAGTTYATRLSPAESHAGVRGILSRFQGHGRAHVVLGARAPSRYFLCSVCVGVRGVGGYVAEHVGTMAVACPACTFACDEGATVCPICNTSLDKTPLQSCPACTLQQSSKRQTCELCGYKLDGMQSAQIRPAGKLATATPTAQKKGTKRKQPPSGAPPSEWPGIRSFFSAAMSAPASSSQQATSARADAEAGAFDSESVNSSEIIDLVEPQPSNSLPRADESSAATATSQAAATIQDTSSSVALAAPDRLQSGSEPPGVELGPAPRPDELELPLVQFNPRRAGCGSHESVPYALVATALDALEATRR